MKDHKLTLFSNTIIHPIVINMPLFRCQCDPTDCQKIADTKVNKFSLIKITLSLEKSFLRKNFSVRKSIPPQKKEKRRGLNC